MATYRQPIGDGTQWVMKWEDYAQHGFKEELAWKEDHEILIYPDCKREIRFKDENER